MNGKRFGLLLLATAALSVAGVAYATIPDTGGVIHGCFKAGAGDGGGGGGNGALRVIDTGKGETCKNSELALDWNQMGPQGPQGLQGPKGDKGDMGDTGPQGPPGPSQVFFAQTAPKVVGDEAELVGLSDLPAGKYVFWTQITNDDVGPDPDPMGCDIRLNGQTVDLGSALGTFAGFLMVEGQTVTEVVPLTVPAGSRFIVNCSSIDKTRAGGRVTALQVNAIN